MTEEELQGLIDLVEESISDVDLTADEIGNDIQHLIDKEVMSEKHIQSESFKTNTDRIISTIGENLEEVNKAYKASKTGDERKGRTAPSKKTTRLKDLADKLKEKSKELKEIQTRIVEAQSQEIDMTDYMNSKEMEVKELEARMKGLDEDDLKASVPVTEDQLNENANKMRKFEYTKTQFEKYNSKVAELKAEEAKPDADRDDDKIAKIKEELEKIKTEIKSDKCFHFNNDDKIQNAKGEDVSFEDCLNKNQSIESFIDGTVKNSKGVQIENLNGNMKDALYELGQDIKNKSNFEAVKELCNQKGYGLDDLTADQYKAVIKELKEKHDKAKKDALITKKELDAKKDSIESYKAKQKALAGMTTSNDKKSIQNAWDKYIPDSEKTALMDQSQSWRGRFNFWRQDAEKGRISSFFNAFRKNKTQNTMKYNKIQSKRAAIERENVNRTNKFREELVKLAKDRKVNDADKAAIYEKMNESEVIRDDERGE